MSGNSRQVRLAHPVGEPRPTDREHVEEPTGQPGGKFLVQVLCLPAEPAMRGWMNAGQVPRPPGGGRRGDARRCGGKVIASRRSGFAVDNQVPGAFGAPECCVSDGRGVTEAGPAAACQTVLKTAD
ncbi:hypothetical protein [Streptomyces sp. NBC_00557]|uniref:hypothetical protein n=1 Tax=Streptomyces sp. NBC_00557 TaxID=2975776 RepID=UPI002E8142F3|nr:hypothetical protein [Streptomyces sp. NBC_00557]WUC38624.1 hypothetical protein OG956_32510 [Streptomyces sp. NBC_00557]